jgi:hypothetical protein
MNRNFPSSFDNERSFLRQCLFSPKTKWLPTWLGLGKEMTCGSFDCREVHASNRAIQNQQSETISCQDLIIILHFGTLRARLSIDAK